jgi:hypothetical protein
MTLADRRSLKFSRKNIRGHFGHILEQLPYFVLEFDVHLACSQSGERTPCRRPARVSARRQRSGPA